METDVKMASLEINKNEKNPLKLKKFVIKLLANKTTLINAKTLGAYLSKFQIL